MHLGVSRECVREEGQIAAGKYAKTQYWQAKNRNDAVGIRRWENKGNELKRSVMEDNTGAKALEYIAAVYILPETRVKHQPPPSLSSSASLYWEEYECTDILSEERNLFNAVPRVSSQASLLTYRFQMLNYLTRNSITAGRFNLLPMGKLGRCDFNYSCVGP